MRFGMKRFNPIFMISGLMDSVVFSSGGFGSYDGSDDDGIDLTDLQGTGDDSGQDDEITLDDDGNALDDLYKPKEGEEDKDADDDSSEDDPVFPTQEEMTTELKERIESYNVPDDMIPEDFDMSDRKQVRELLSTVGRHAVQTALATMFKPIQTAMQQQEHSLRKAIKTSVKGGLSADKEQQILSDTIPAVNDPAQKEIVNTLFTRAKAKHPGNPLKAAQVARAAMIQLGINPNGRKNKKASAGGGLDSYAKLPQIEPARRPTDRNRDGLQRK